MNYEEHRREMLKHCIRLAQIDRHYAWWAAQRYAADSHGVLADLPRQLTAAMLALAATKTPTTRGPHEHRRTNQARSR
ncbi:hypothetical protein [Delftia tsuruhatensis]|uniref:hypothetical protein n=1 Tax=Delftia tsuruhatensis TaxID=180282 RepID=UPI000FF88762|nr:hypothetical protein [Delftia tsuruhatensis]